MKYIVKIAVLLFITLITTYCKDPQSNENLTDNQSSNRATMLKFMADEIIIPSYANFKIKLDSLNYQINTFSTNPTKSNLQTLRATWINTYVEWQKVEFIAFGPAHDNSLKSFINVYPIDKTVINTNINSKNVNFEYASNSNAQGFPAIDYLLNGIATNDDAIISLYASSSDTIAPKRLNYLKKIGEQMSLKFNQTYSTWTNTFKDSFVNSTNLSATGSTSNLINGYVYAYESFIRNGKIGKPAGAMTFVSDTTLVEGLYAKNISKKLAITAQQAFVDFFNGKSVTTGVEGFSLKAYLNGIGAKDSKTGKLLTEVLGDQFTVIKNQLNSLDDNFIKIVQTDNQKLITTHDELQKVVRLLKVDMTSAMSITISYSDSDTD